MISRAAASVLRLARCTGFVLASVDPAHKLGVTSGPTRAPIDRRTHALSDVEGRGASCELLYTAGWPADRELAAGEPDSGEREGSLGPRITPDAIADSACAFCGPAMGSIRTRSMR